MSKFLRFVFSLFILIISNNIHASSRVTSVNAYPKGENIIITYQLSELANIKVYVSTDGGKTFSPLKNISGDIGDNVKPGNKQIVWDVLSDYEQFIFQEVCFKVAPFNNNGYEYVDLGLPSGLLWATCNVGATKPEERGDYFSWGETQPKSTYNSNTYTTTKYNPIYIGSTGDKTILELSDDVANVNWGGDWRIPTLADYNELRTKCTWIWTTKNSQNGYTVTGPNGNSIFLPAVGCYLNSYNYEDGNFGDYWSSSLRTYDTEYAYNLFFRSNEVSMKTNYRHYGFSVRPVLRSGFTYVITFDGNGAEGMMPSITVEHSEIFTIPENKFTHPKYKFICWNTKPDGTGIKYEAGAKFSVDSDITLYPQFGSQTSMESSNLTSSVPSKNFFMLNGGFTTLPDYSYGLTYAWVKRAGFYFSAMSNFKFRFNSDYVGDSSGYVNGTYPLYSGKKEYTKITATTGLMIRFCEPLYMYLGGGYGYRGMYYETVGNEWVAIQGNHCIYHGGVGEIGLIGNIYGFSLSLGLSVITDLHNYYPEAKVGIGYCF